MRHNIPHTQMATAMTKALAATPTTNLKLKSLMERVWSHVKDKPGLTATAIAQIYGASASQALSSLYLRNMVQRTSERRRDTQGHMRNVHIYSTNMREYEPLPLPKRTDVPQRRSSDALVAELAQAKQGVETEPVAQTAPAHSPEAWATPASLDDFVDSLTVRQAHQLYAKLQTMFR